MHAMDSGRKWVAVLVGWGLSLMATPAWADDPAAAEALFESGVTAMKAGKWDAACPAIAESFRLEPRPGTLFTLAECWRKAGKIATALARYDEYLRVFDRMSAAEKGGQRGRDKIAREQAQALRGQVPRLTVMVLEAPEGAYVERDGEKLGAPSLGQPLPIDPGEHTIVLELDGRVLDTQSVTLAAGENKTVRLRAAANSEVTPTAGSAGVAATTGAPRDPARADSGADSGDSQRTLGYVVGAVGVAGILVGSITGLMVFGKKSTIEDNCAGTDCNREGKEAADSAQTLATVSTIAFGVGLAGVGAGSVLVLTAGGSDESARSFGIGLSGSF